MPLTLKIDGPYEIPRTALPGGTRIGKDEIAEFWQTCPYAGERGCYVFGVRAGRGTLPGYVGKATRSFEQEVFQSHKLNKYRDYMARTRRGTPVLFFAIAERNRGRVNVGAIADCELELIYYAWRTNPDIVNERGLRGPSFVIPHVTDGRRGQPSGATREFRTMMGLGPVAPRVEVQVVNQTPHVVSVGSSIEDGQAGS